MNSEINKENVSNNSNGKFSKTYRDKKIEISLKELPEIIKSIRSNGKTGSLSSEKKRYDNRPSNRSPLKDLSEFRKINFQLSPSDLEYKSLKLKATKNDNTKLNRMKESRAILFEENEIQNKENSPENLSNAIQNDINKICERNRDKASFEMNIKIDEQNNIEVCNENNMYDLKIQNNIKSSDFNKINKLDYENMQLNMNPELYNQIATNNSSNKLTTYRNSSFPNSNAKSYENLKTNTSKNSDGNNPLLKHYDKATNNQFLERNFDANNGSMQALMQQNKGLENVTKNISDRKITRMHFLKIDEPIRQQTLDTLAYSHKTIKETNNEVGTQSTPQICEKNDQYNPNNDSLNIVNIEDFQYEINIRPHLLSSSNSQKKLDFEKRTRTQARNSVTSNISVNENQCTSFVENKTS